ncbi:MAG: winged helix-turn-helix domain-containing protein [Woeseia sp.]
MIGEWLVSPSRNSLRRQGEPVGRTIEPRLMRLLAALVTRSGGTATKDALIAEVWDGLIISDEALAQAVSRLRRELGDDPRQPRYIETVRKIGYRLAAPVSFEGKGKSRPARRKRFTTLAAGSLGVAAAMSVILLAILRYERPYRLQAVAVDLRDERRPSISPDGRQLAYEVVDRDGGTSIWISDGEAGSWASLPGTSGAQAPVWLSNRSLAMQLRNSSHCDVLQYDLATRSMQPVARCDGSGYPDLTASSDGRRLAFNASGANPSGPRAIHVVEIGGRAYRLTTPPPTSWGDYDPEFSPDGQSLVFARASSEGQQDLYVTTLTGGERRLTRRFGNIHGATWASDKEIVYAARSGGRYGLRRIDVRTGRDQLLQLPSFDTVQPVIRDEIFLVETRRFQTKLVPTGSGPSIDAWRNSTGINVHPALSPDGRSAVFVSDRSGALELWLLDLNSGRLRQLTRYGGPFVGAPRFAPDGRMIVYEVRDADESDIYALDLESGTSRPLVTGRSFDTAASVSADGRTLYFASDREGSWAVYAKPLSDSGAPTQVVADAFAAIEAPDGSLYFTRRSRPGLFRRDSGNGRVSVVDDRFAIEDWGAFAPVRDGVIFVERSGNGRSNVVLASRSGEKRTLLVPAGRIPFHDPVLAAQPDLTQIVHVEADTGNGDLYRVSR